MKKMKRAYIASAICVCLVLVSVIGAVADPSQVGDIDVATDSAIGENAVQGEQGGKIADISNSSAETEPESNGDTNQDEKQDTKSLTKAKNPAKTSNKKETPDGIKKTKAVDSSVITDVTLKKYDTDNEYDERNIATLDDNITLEMSWDLSDIKVEATDTYSFKLPKEIAVNSNVNGDLGDYGTYTISTSGEVVFTFNQNAANASGIVGAAEGKITLNTSFNKETSGVRPGIDRSRSTNYDMEFDFGYGKKESIPVIFRPIYNSTTISKSGTVYGEDGTPNNQTAADNGKPATDIDWTVYVNSNRGAVIDGGVITDTVPAGLKVMSAEVYEADITINGNYSEVTGTDFVAEGKASLDKSTGKVSLSDSTLNGNKIYKIVYKTEIDDPAATAYRKYYYNSVSFENAGGVSTTGNGVYAYFSKAPTNYPLLTKSGSDTSNEYKTWTVYYNQNRDTIPANEAVISDTMKLELLKGSKYESVTIAGIVYIAEKDTANSTSDYTVYKKGDESSIRVEVLDNGTYKPIPATDYTITLAKDKVNFELKFNKQITDTYRVTYGTYFDKKEYSGYDPEKLGDSFTFKETNTVKSGDKEAAATKDVHISSIMSKKMLNIDYGNKTVEWEVTVNAAKEGLKKYSLGDYLPSYLKLVNNSIVVKKNGTNVTPNEGKDYNLYISGDSDFGSRDTVYDIATPLKTSPPSFQIDILSKNDTKDPGKNTPDPPYLWNDTYTVTYKTNFDTTHKDFPTDYNVQNHVESVYAIWTVPPNPKIEGMASMDGKGAIDKTTANPDRGSKFASYNYSNGKINWEVRLNHNNSDIGKGGYIRDPILTAPTYSEQEYVEGSAKLYKFGLNSSGSEINLTTPVTEKYDIKYTPADKTLTVTFPDGISAANNARLRLVYETDTSQSYTVGRRYDNTAYFSRTGKTDDEKPYSGYTYVTNTDMAIYKAGSAVDIEGEKVLRYGVYTNYTCHKYDDFVFIDDLAGQGNYKDLKIYGFTIKNGYNPGWHPSGHNRDATPLVGIDLRDVKPDSVYDYTHTIDSEGKLRVEFKNRVEKGYYVDYTVIPDPNRIDKLTMSYTNTATNSGRVPNTETVLTGKSSLTLQTQFSTGTGQSSSLSGTVKVNKVDSISKNPITDDNAAFDLYFANSEGEITDVTGAVNPNAQPARTGETSGGAIEFSKLYKGYYLLVETSAPEGYGISENLAKGELIYLSNEKSDSSETGTLYLKYEGETIVPEGAVGDDIKEIKRLYSLPLENEKTVVNITKKGAVKLSTDNESKLTDTESAEAQFRIKNTNGETMKFDVNVEGGKSVAAYSKDGSSELIVTANGTVKVMGLLPGEYIMTEVSAGGGYLVNTADTKFSVAMNKDGTFTPINVEKMNYKGRAELTKTNVIDEPLEGVGFDLVKVDKETDSREVINSGVLTDVNGKISTYGLVPGDYEWVEKAAIDEYVLNTSPVAFTITDSAVDVPATVSAVMVNDWVKTQVSGTKTWNDENDKDRIRPADISLILKADGNIVSDVTPEWTKNESNVWRYTYTGLDKYNSTDGKLITYTVDEEPVIGYEKTINGLNITNSHTPQTVLGDTGTPGGGNGNVLGEEGTPDGNGDDGTVLGEEAKTSDMVNIIGLVAVMLIASFVTLILVLKRRKNRM